MSLQSLLNNLFDSRLFRVCTSVIEFKVRIVVRQEAPCNFLFENVMTIRYHVGVVLNILKKEPDRVSRVITWCFPITEKIWYHAMFEHTSKSHDMFSSI